MKIKPRDTVCVVDDNCLCEFRGVVTEIIVFKDKFYYRILYPGDSAGALYPQEHVKTEQEFDYVSLSRLFRRDKAMAKRFATV